MSDKIFSKDIDNIDANKIGEVIVQTEDGKKTLRGTELKKYLADKVHGGKTATALEKDLAKEGVKNSQIDKRKKIIQEATSGEPEAESKVHIRKAVDNSFINKNKRSFSTVGSSVAIEQAAKIRSKNGSATSVSKLAGGINKTSASTAGTLTKPLPSVNNSRGVKPVGF